MRDEESMYVKAVGLPPGTLVHVGEKRIEKSIITIIDYNEQEISQIVTGNPKEAFPSGIDKGVVWVNVDGIYDTDIISKICDYYEVHPLTQEDIVNTTQRPKVEDNGNYMFIVLKMLYMNEDKKIEGEQVSFILEKNHLLTFQEQQGDVFNPVRDRLNNGRGTIRRLKADYLAYSLMDAVVDNYFVILEEMGELMEDLEDELINNPRTETLQNIQEMKRKMLYIRRAVWPLREIVSRIQRTGSRLIDPGTDIYIRDLYDHVIQVIDRVEIFREILSSMMDIYLSSISNKMNEVMKTLTIIATIFIPLTFIAGVYGMNFDFMPELHWKWAYFTVLGIMLAVALTLVAYFKKKKWM